MSIHRLRKRPLSDNLLFGLVSGLLCDFLNVAGLEILLKPSNPGVNDIVLNTVKQWYVEHSSKQATRLYAV